MKRESVFGMNSLSSNFKVPDVNLNTLKKKKIVSDENSDIEKKYKLLIERNENELNRKYKRENNKQFVINFYQDLKKFTSDYKSNMNEYYKLKEENKNFSKKFRDKNSKLSVLPKEISNNSNVSKPFHRKSVSLGCELFYNQNVNVSFREHYLKNNKKLTNIFDQNVLIIDDKKISDYLRNASSACRNIKELQKFRKINKNDLKYLNKLTNIVNEKLTFVREEEDEVKKFKIRDEVEKNKGDYLTTDFTNKFNLNLGNTKESNKTTLSPLKFNKTKIKLNHKVNIKTIKNNSVPFPIDNYFKDKKPTNKNENLIRGLSESKFIQKLDKSNQIHEFPISSNSNCKDLNNSAQKSIEPKIVGSNNGDNIHVISRNRDKKNIFPQINLNKTHLPIQLKNNLSDLGSNDLNISIHKIANNKTVLFPCDKDKISQNLKMTSFKTSKIKIKHQHTKSLAFNQGDRSSLNYEDKQKMDQFVESSNKCTEAGPKRRCGILQGITRKSKNLTGTEIIKHQELTNRIDSLNLIYDKINFEEEFQLDGIFNTFYDNLKILNGTAHNYANDKDPYSVVKCIKEMKNQIKFFDLNEKYHKICEESGPIGDEILNNINGIKHENKYN